MNPDLRFEMKYVLAASEADEGLRWVEGMREMRPEFPARSVNSVYFDTYDRRFARESDEGNVDRIKPRLRWYAPERGTASAGTEVVLELKCKRGACGFKHRATAGGLGDDPRELLQRGLLSGVGHPAFRSMMSLPLFPMLRVQYLRRYFAGADGIRVTVDTMLRFSDPGDPCGFGAAAPFEACVIEVKFAPWALGKAAHLASALRSSPRRFSKYATGLRALNGYERG
jgi:hypothetical protein